jgi:hypothetical protein
MTIQTDSREHQHAIQDILAEFDRQGVKHYCSKLFVGDYMSLDNPRLVVDRKQNLHELCGNVAQQHERFRREMLRAQENGIKIVFLCEHGHGIKSLDDVLWWDNPREKVRVKVNGRWITKTQKVIQGDTLYKILSTMQRRYGVEFLFCDKRETGRRIIEILKGEEDDK